jgi:hypothetical protein
LGNVTGADNRTEDLGQEGSRLLGKMLQGPVQNTVQARQEVQRLEEDLMFIGPHIILIVE